MNDEKSALILYRLERAESALHEAAVLLESGHCNAYVNRLYYACFYAVSSLFVVQDISASKHSHLRSVFHRDFVKSGIVPVALGKHFDRLFTNRQEGDYADFVVFKEVDVAPWLEQTREFVKYIKGIIEKTVRFTEEG